VLALAGVLIAAAVALTHRPGSPAPAPAAAASAPATSAPPTTVQTIAGTSPAPRRRHRRRADPGRLPQTRALPSARTASFDARMRALWTGVVTGRLRPAMAAFFPKTAYAQVKAIADPATDYRDRLVSAYRLDLLAAHRLVGAVRARLVGVLVPHEWTWIPPGACFNGIGYWHAPGSRLVYEQGGALRSFGVFSLISWRGDWYVVHLSSYTAPGTVDTPASGRGSFGPAGGC
jgi:hypothetical protein